MQSHLAGAMGVIGIQPVKFGICRPCSRWGNSPFGLPSRPPVRSRSHVFSGHASHPGHLFWTSAPRLPPPWPCCPGLLGEGVQKHLWSFPRVRVATLKDMEPWPSVNSGGLCQDDGSGANDFAKFVCQFGFPLPLPPPRN